MSGLELKGKKALVMGLGLHDGGLGVTRFLVEQGAEVTVTDLRSPEVLAPTLEKLRDLPVEYVLGEHREKDFRQAEIVVRNPAVPRESPYLQMAREAGASIEMEMTLFFKLCPSPFILGITGTRGKTTTTVLAGEMMKAWKPDTVVAGNLRVSALQKLKEIGPETPVVLELSSWQLEGMGEQHLSPRYAAITNMSPDHLNRYRDMQDYADAKRNIYRWQGEDGVVVLNADDEIVSKFAEDAPGKVYQFSLKPLDLEGAFLRHGSFYWTINQDDAFPNNCHSWLLQIPGSHNQANALAAIALVSAAGCPKEAIVKGLENFKGVPDRLELVRELDGVRYYNDTTATSPAGTVAALEAFEDDNGQIVLIAGGADKKLDFTPMVEAIANTVWSNRLRRLMLLEGSATPKLVEAFQAIGITGIYGSVFTDFKQAIRAAKSAASPGDIVLLSPGCASFGMFLHEFDRGEKFRNIVNSF